MVDTNIGYHVDDFYRDLVRHLDDDGLSTSISKQFSALSSNSDRVSFGYRLLDDYKLFREFQEDYKNGEVSDEYRKKGNECYKSKKIREAIEYYTKSIANATEKSEMMALAFANRSAALYEKGYFEDCLKDIGRALENNYPENLKPKLLSRMKNALALRQEDSSQPFYQNIPTISEEIANERINCSTNAVEIHHSDNLGRYVVASKDIEIGEVIAVEKPFCHLLTGYYSSHCHECLSLCYSLIPCHSCTQALYCSENCKRSAFVYHRYECKILRTLRYLQLDKMKLLPLKICLVTKNIYKDLAASSFGQGSEISISGKYQEIHNLVGNTQSRSIPDLFKRAVIAAVVFNYLKMYTDFFSLPEEEEIFKELFLRHMQTAPCNFHSISEIAQNDEGIYEPEDIGAGAFSFLSMFNHSCNPNVVRQCFGPVVVVRAIRSIKKGDQCFDNYGYHYAVMSKDERRNNLKKQYFFDCQCDACQNDWPLYSTLPPADNDFEVEQNELTKLMEGNVEYAKTILRKVLLHIGELETAHPNKQFAEKQEILKQCFALLGNIKRTL